MASRTEFPNLQGYLITDARTIPMGAGRGDFIIESVAKDSPTNPSRWLAVPRGMEGLVEPALNFIKEFYPDTSIRIDALPTREGEQPRYLLQSRSILDTGDYLECLAGIISRFDTLDKNGSLTQEEVTVQVIEALTALANNS